mgnify:CR=1 FL=1
MKGYIDKFDWLNVEPMKYWSFPASVSDATKKETVRNLIFSGDYIGSLKVDGYYQRLLKDEDGNCFMIARSRNTKGEVVNKIDWVPHLRSWLDSLPNGTCVLAEAYLPGMEGSKNVTSILGCLRDKSIERQKKTPLHFHIFDCMAFNGKNYDKTPYEERIEHLTEMQCAYPGEPYVHYTQFFEGGALWEQLQAYLASGREGMVIMRKDAIVYNKRTPARVSIKVKQELKETIDCIIIGMNPPTKIYNGKSIESWQYWVNDITDERLPLATHYNDYCLGAPIVPVTKNYYNKWAGSLKLGLVDNGKVIHYGDLSGLTEEMLNNWQNYVGKVVEVGGMMIDAESKVIRHPKMIQLRQDKTPKECTIDQIK